MSDYPALTDNDIEKLLAYVEQSRDSYRAMAEQADALAESPDTDPYEVQTQRFKRSLCSIAASVLDDVLREARYLAS